MPHQEPLPQHDLNRPQLIQEISTALNSHGQVNLNGGAGIGKSHLAAEVARSFQTQHKRVCYHHTAPGLSSQKLAVRIAHALGHHLPVVGPEALANILAQQETLLQVLPKGSFEN